MNMNIIKENVSKYDETLKDTELLALFIGKEAVQDLENHQIYRIGDLKNYTDKELLEFKNINHQILIKIKALLELLSRNHIKEYTRKITSSGQAQVLCLDMQYFDQEVFRLICLDNVNHVLKTIDLFKGGIGESIVDVRIVMKELLKTNSTAFIVAHNHPGGSITPSEEDLNITEKLKKAGKMFNIKLLDHLIIGKNNKFVSLKKEKYI